ncbi:MAG: glycosyltransferase family 2 protein [Bacteriovoracaceae bacterium]|nr:glycosyltransferase family 2 protein [Bacteriovoracaceae bacterium]
MNFSVIVPNYNKETVLDLFFSSFLNFRNESTWEILFIDDCSNDNSLKIANSYLESLPLKVISLDERSGPAKARNLGLEKASFDTIVFCDSDIAFNADVLKDALNFFNDNKCDVLNLSLSTNPIGNNGAGALYLLEEYQALLEANSKTGPCDYFTTTFSFIKKSLILSVGGFNESYKGADIEDLEIAAHFSRETKNWFNYELQFDHQYPSLSLVLKKSFKRSFHISKGCLEDELNVITSVIRKIRYFLMCFFPLLFLSNVLFFKTECVFIYTLGFTIIFLNRFFLSKGLEKYGFIKTACLFLGLHLYVLSVCAGYLYGKISLKKSL